MNLLLLVQAAAPKVGSGVVSGGWSYVWAGYGLTWITLALYALSLYLRRPQEPAGPEDK
jgi:hypothetical protein